MQQAFIGVDVGTASARAGIFDVHGTLLATARHPIAVWHEAGDVVEQSSTDIWNACAQAVREAMKIAGLPASAIGGIGFDATCSLVLLDAGANPVSVSSSGDPARNVIVWMDHRATGQAQRINQTGDDVLRYVGGIISPEMQTPKLLWLKENLPASYAGAAHFLDLADFLSFRATGSTARSICTVTCKWTYLSHERRWSDTYFERIGLAELVADRHARIGAEIVEPGTPLARGLSETAAAELGLLPGTPVGASLIDAHAGGVGTIGGRGRDGEPVRLQDRLAYIMGTSACIMATTVEPAFLTGIWGPYFSAMVPGFWLNEGGQSAAGAGIDHLVRSHPAFAEATAAAKAEGLGLLDFLEQRATGRFARTADAARLARDIHVLPEFLGNRSPYADPQARAVIAGLDLDDGIDSLERLFVAGLCGLAYGVADILDVMRSRGLSCEMMVMSGGASRSRLARQIMADTTGLVVALPATPEPVLLGAAMLGAVAGKAYPSIADAMGAMSGIGELAMPTASEMADLHAAKRRVSTLLRTMDRESRTIMRNVAGGHGGR
ncbi:FGGY-family carbohydrate kinase [Bosea sp. 117]|uniref:FGGY-family carbohydrate kinase n=1 Tax=Bosea sp. 117 TaxID=1125973 RepID=UPI000494BE75|nr:FGGY-family carbohydrate kinase [Bosea sp. 117]